VRPFFQGFVVTLVVLVVAAGVTGVLLYRHYDHNIKRINHVFAQTGTTKARPRKVATGAEDFLLVGTDVRTGGRLTTGRSGIAAPHASQRSDTIMIVHLSKGRKAAYVVSIPRDAWVPIPGHGSAKINAAFAYGGPALLRETVEQLTGVHIDHYMEIDFEGFRRMTDAVGGVNIDVPADSYDSARNKQWHAGWQHMDGKDALLYVRQRYGLPNGDLDRVKHQHQYLDAMMAKVRSQGVLGNPVRLTSFLDAFTKSVSVDSGLSGSNLRNLARSLAGLHRNDVHFMTAPYTGFGHVDGQSVVVLNPSKDHALWRAIINDKMQPYAVPATAG
jgi:LCP family protein required for cell wall assembly